MTFEFQDHWKLITLKSDKPLEITVWAQLFERGLALTRG